MKQVVSGAEIAYDESGSGPALLFIHAGNADRRMWDRQIAAFSGSHRVIRFDLRGFGESPNPAAPYANFEDACELLDALGVERAVVVGDSMGGEVALDLALAHPKRVSGLVLVSTRAALTEASDELKQVWSDADAAYERGDIEAATDIEVAAWIDGAGRTAADLDPAFRARAKAMVRLTWDKIEPGTNDVEQIKLDPPQHGRFGEVRVPVLLVAGDCDQAEIGTSMAILAQEIAGARLVTIENASHLPPLERPEQFNQSMREFLTTVPGGHWR
jgi:3-oxoadipate enol-lactonase